jgi:hypothetical protein
MNAWMNSPGHLSNILSTNNWEIGVGYYAGSGQYYYYWTQDFGRRNGVYPLIINREAATTNSKGVSLYIYCTWSGAQMRLRNDSGSWTAWQPYQSTLIWTLNAGIGEHSVSVELRSGSQTATSSDSIYLVVDPTPCYDFNTSGWVDAGDARDVASRWRNPARYDGHYDSNGDGRIDLRDVEPVTADWGHTCQ